MIKALEHLLVLRWVLMLRSMLLWHLQSVPFGNLRRNCFVNRKASYHISIQYNFTLVSCSQSPNPRNLGGTASIQLERLKSHVGFLLHVFWRKQTIAFTARHTTRIGEEISGRLLIDKHNNMPTANNYLQDSGILGPSGSIPRATLLGGVQFPLLLIMPDVPWMFWRNPYCVEVKASFAVSLSMSMPKKSVKVFVWWNWTSWLLNNISMKKDLKNCRIVAMDSESNLSVCELDLVAIHKLLSSKRCWQCGDYRFGERTTTKQLRQWPNNDRCSLFLVSGSIVYHP